MAEKFRTPWPWEKTAAARKQLGPGPEMKEKPISTDVCDICRQTVPLDENGCFTPHQNPNRRFRFCEGEGNKPEDLRDKPPKQK